MRDKLDDELFISFIPMSSVSEEGYLIDFQIRKYSEVKQGFPSFKDHDIIIAKITPCFENGKAALISGLLNGVGFGSTEFHVIRAHAHYLPGFLFSYLNADNIRRLGKSHMIGSGGQQRVPSAFFEDLRLSLPDQLEQQKIAACLSSLDELIAAHTQKLEALKAYKKGLLQQLFPAEGETVPRLRFPEFRDEPEWEEKRLEQVVKNVTTGKLDANAMVENGKYRFYTCAKNYYLIDTYAFDTEAILIAGNGAYLGYIHHYKGKFNAYQRTYVLSDFDINVAFLKYYLERHLPARISSEKKDGNTPYIVLATITEALIATPATTYEQQKIADLLTSLDELITAQTRKIDSLKQHKKALMQQLFPQAEEE
jgi:type I restriction enzyme S subunit